MKAIAVTLAGAAACLAAGCAKPSGDLLGEAHQAALALSDVHGSPVFDDTATQVFPNEGLVCGSKVKTRSAFGESGGYERIYFSRRSGAALEGESPSWLPLANACIAALERRLAATNHRLKVGAAAPDDTRIEVPRAAFAQARAPAETLVAMLR